MASVSQRATLDDLLHTEGKAELIGGRIVHLAANGYKPSRIAGRIYRSLAEYAETGRIGEAYTGSIAFAIAELPSGRESFSPDASYYVGPLPENVMGFIEGPPTFAVEVRSENDYGDAAEAEMTAKRVDYFAAGTKVVWDVDTVNESIDCYRIADPTNPVRFVRGQIADAEPAVPGWRVKVDDVFG